MEKQTIYSSDNLCDGVEVDSVGEFIKKIKEITDSDIKNGRNDTLFFRGQKTNFWKVQPSIFRDDCLNVEHELMQQPLFHVPNEFSKDMELFEIMAKYQHYGMCTRLLDLTTNPLVALYFACNYYGEVKYKTDEGVSDIKEPYGIVYYKRDYPVIASNQNVKIISAMAQMNLNQDNKLKSVLKRLCEQSIISSNDKKKWLTSSGYLQFSKIIESNYIVNPIYSNERLIRQSGRFMLAGGFSIIGDNVEKAVVEKDKNNFEFDFDGFFYVDGENKNEILQELDRCNINESTLFPELEHQLSYIRNKMINK